MNIRRQRRESGIALIIVMISVIILTILAGGFAYSMKVEMRLAMNSRNFSELEWLGRSGMEYAKWILAEDMKIDPKDANYDIWAGGTGGINASNSPIAEIQLPVTIQLGKGEFTLKPMVDNERKVNINQANETLLEHVLIGMGVDAGEIAVVTSSILDWIDPDDLENMQGAESDYYLSQDPPYEAKNGPIDDLSELLFIQGVTPEMYRGGGDKYLFERRSGGGGHFLEQEEQGYEFGLRDVFTPLSSGQLNGLTVDERTLALLPGMDDFLASQYIQMRAGLDGIDGTEDDQPVDPSFLVPDPTAQAQLRALLGNARSTTFEVTVIAKMGGVSREFRGVIVRRSPNDIRLVSFYAPDDK